MSDEEWNAFWDGYILAQGMNQAMKYKQQNQNGQKKTVSRREAKKVQEDAKKLQQEVQRILNTDYEALRKQADEQWSAEHNAVPLAETYEVYVYTMDHGNEVHDLLVGPRVDPDDPEWEAYSKAQLAYRRMSEWDRAEKFCLKKYGKHLYRNRADDSYRAYVKAYIDKHSG